MSSSVVVASSVFEFECLGIIDSFSISSSSIDVDC